ncbi:MAG: cytochrome P450 [Myxococcales bacterium]|nr:cytochrome P450 [Myxococcales bacterium]
MNERGFAQFPARRTCPFHPAPEYVAAQREQPISRVTLASGLQAVLITRHHDVRALLDDPRLSADEGQPGYPFLYQGAFASPLKGTFMRLDGEAHIRVRRMLAKDFTVKRAEAMRSHIEKIVDECLTAMAEAGRGGRAVDLVPALAFPVPSRTICHLLGVPYEDRDVFEKNTRAMINHRSSQDEVQAAVGAVFGYLDDLVRRKQEHPCDDLISRLVREELDTGKVGRQELVTIILILLVGGHETTATMIGLGVFALLEHHQQRQQLLADSTLWESAVEELLRHQTISQSPIQRVALADIEVGGELIRAGEGVLFELAIANRDPAAFPDADRLDLQRNARGHVAFSYGAHHCLGHALARVELEIVLRKLLQRFPTLALAAPVAEVPVRPHNVGLFGVEALPVTW